MKGLLAFLILLVLAPVAAQAQVQASLVALDRSVQPGKSTTVALRLEHEAPWHSFWINAGIGFATSLKWELPAGWQAGHIQWPTPILIKDSKGVITGHGYEGIVYLPVEVTVPADATVGESIELKARARWLMCTDVCIPSSANVSVTVPVSADVPERDTAVAAELAKMQMPQVRDDWKLSATRTAKSVNLVVTGVGSIRSPHFFSEDAYVQYDLPQSVDTAAGKLTMTLPISEEAETETQQLVGVLAYWDEQGQYRGARVNVPFGVASGSATSSAGAAAGDGGAGLPVTLLLAVVGGLVLNLMPCVFPVLGIKVVGFVNEAGSDRRKVVMHGLMFTLGVLICFWGLAGLLAVLRAGGQELGWGFQLQSAPFVFVLTVIMLVFALSLSGVFEFGLRATTVGSDLHSLRGISGSFFTGVLATVVATPCSAPFLAPALGAALTLPVVQSFVVFTAIGIGLSAPYLLLSVFPQAVRALPRPGRWMNTFKQVMAFPLYATVAYLIWVLAGQTSENGLLTVLFALVLISMAVWLYGHYNAPDASSGRVRIAFAGALCIFVLGMNVGWPRAAAATDITWEKWSIQRVAELRAQGRHIYVDFTARWCATCQANKKLVFSSDAVKKFVRDNKVALLKADWTNNDPTITAELAKWQRSAVPFNLIYRADVPEPIVLPELLTPAVVLAKFRDADPGLRGEATPK